ncbi:MAG TPA: hypothetical protein VFQ75_02455 [Candidatus Limnocylindrales bacterium]|nr:hypothetical protein [Candidatus Limnocylindrales bacterium]
MIRRLLLLDHPQETRFFVFIGGFGLVLAGIYWFLTYEVAGTILLAGFGAGAGLIGLALVRSRPPAVAAGVARRAAHDTDPDALDASADGTGGVATPFEDPSGRVPGESLAPLSLGLGIALSLTAIVFGPWLLVAGILPLAWGAWTWATGARAELDATVSSENRRASQPEASTDA